MATKNPVKIYATQITEPWAEDVFHRLLDLLTKEAQTKVLSENGWERQHGHLARKLLLLHAMHEAGIDTSGFFENIEHTASGKPYLTGAPHFSLSNEGAVAICAISETSVVGADIARLKPLNLNDYREMMTYLEWREIYSHMIPLRRFYEFLTIKQSVIKADGTNDKKRDIKEIYVQPDVAFSSGKYWYIYPVEIEYYAHVAFIVCSNPHADVEVVDVDLTTLF